MRLGILGGTFDPIHIGHLRLAEEMCEQLHLSKVLMMPGAQPPHKNGLVVTPFTDRLEMTKLGASCSGYLEVSDIEGDRKGPSYSIETLRIIHEQYSSQLELFFILGSDAFKEIKTWKEYKHLFQLTNLVVIERPGNTMDKPGDFLESLEIGIKKGKTENIFTSLSGNQVILNKSILMDISSTRIRQIIKTGKSINFMVPQKVKEYIIKKGLYK